MKKEERDRARQLRKEGRSLNEIIKELGVAKSSVSLWVRGIELSDIQKNRLLIRGHTVESIELRRQARLAKEKARRKVYFDAAVKEIEELSTRDLSLFGTALYWGEGSKTKRGSVDFTNSDPRSIQVMMRYFREICEVPRNKFRGHVILHPHLDATRAERYWSKISGIPRGQFFKTSMQHNRASKNKKDSLPLGTFSIVICDTVLYLKIMGWMEGSYTKAVPASQQVSCRFHQYL